REQLLRDITQLFADESGYDLADLEPAFELEADLGIDTVKQAEIFTALREKYGLPRDDEFKLSDVPTLHAVVDYVIDQLAKVDGGDDRLGKKKAARASAWAAENRFHVRATERLEIEPVRSGGRYDGRVVALFGRDAALKQAVREALLKRGANVHVLELDHARPEALEARLRDLGGRPADDLIVLGPDSVGDLAWVEETSREAFNAARAFARARTTKGDARIMFAARTDGVLGWDSRDPASWIVGGFAGLAKSLAQEWQEARVVAVDLDRSVSLSDSASALLDEGAVVGPSEIGLRGGRFTLRRTEEPSKVDAGALAEGSVLVATGGARGVTFEMVRELCRRSKLKVVLVGRTAPVKASESVLHGKSEAEQKDVARAALTARGERVTPVAIKRFIEREQGRIEVQGNVDTLVALGAKVEVLSADLTDPDSLDTLAKTVRDRFGQCDVLLHGAGREESKMLVDKNDDSFMGTFTPKCSAFVAIHDRLKPKRSVLMGSIAGRFGNAGQTDYAQSNELLAAFSRGTPGAICLDWTAWGDVGMATKEGVKKVLESLGVDFLPAATGAVIGADLVASPLTGDVVIAGSLGELEKAERGLSGASAATLPVLFDREETRGSQKVYVRTLDPARDQGLDHHRLQGTAVLPGVLGVEMMTRAAELASGQTVCALENVAFASPLKLHRDEAMEVQVRVQDGDERSREVSLVTLFKGPGGKSRERVHFTAKVLFGARTPLSVPHGGSVHLPRSPGISREAIYERYFHGPVFQVLDAPGTLGEDGIAGSTTSEWESWVEQMTHGDFATHPFVREAGFQAAGLWEMVELGRMALPAGAERIELSPDRVSGGVVRIEARRTGSGADGCTFDVWALDSKGAVVDVMRGYRTVVLRHLADDERFEPSRGGMPAPDWLWVEISEI
ncbi:MAG: SDR family NAD(P)-dependent oxidoreductase, partial [Myxococcota bacterium]